MIKIRLLLATLTIFVGVETIWADCQAVVVSSKRDLYASAFCTDTKYSVATGGGCEIEHSFNTGLKNSFPIVNEGQTITGWHCRYSRLTEFPERAGEWQHPPASPSIRWVMFHAIPSGSAQNQELVLIFSELRNPQRWRILFMNEPEFI